MLASKARAFSFGYPLDSVFALAICYCLLNNLMLASKVVRLPSWARVIVHGKTLYPSLMVATKARAFSLGYPMDSVFALASLYNLV